MKYDYFYIIIERDKTEIQITQFAWGKQNVEYNLWQIQLSHHVPYSHIS